MDNLAGLAERYHVLVRSDTQFRREARVLQSMWREAQGYDMGMHRGTPLGSLLPMPWAKETLANYMTETIRNVVRAEVLDEARSAGKVFQTPRIFANLLSSQPLCFNLFGELHQSLALAGEVFEDLAPDRVRRVTGIEFEYSPGRHDPRYTNDGSAFDVYLAFETPRGRKGFAGIEVKYSENLAGKAAEHRARYDEVADEMGCFTAERSDLRSQPLQQIWRDHLLAGSLRHQDDFDDGFFVFLYPEGNVQCAEAVDRYRDYLEDDDTFVAWTLEEVASVVKARTEAEWIDRFIDRYLAFGALDDECG